MNRTSAIHWLTKSWHNLSGAKLFYEADHYTDVTAVELHYSIEKIFKTFLAFYNKPIKKSHNLPELYELVNDFIKLNKDELYLIHTANKYHVEEVYPQFDRSCILLGIEKLEVQN